MSSHAFFVQTCQEERKKRHPRASVNFSEFSKKCLESWKTMSAKEKRKCEDMAKAEKAQYENKMKTYLSLKGETKDKFKGPNAPKRLWELPLPRTEAGTTNRAPKHRAPVPGSADHIPPSDERPRGLSLLGRDETPWR